MPNILIVDDEDDIREAFSSFLTKHGYTVKDASDGNQALKILADERFDLMVTDIIMPNKEGVETILSVREQFPDMKIIAMSGGGRNIAAEDALSFVENLGVSYTFQKPFNRNDMLNAINDLLKNS